MIRILSMCLFVLGLITCCDARTITHVYKFKMKQYVPRIYNNEQSLGKRKYQLQTIQGYLHISFDENSEYRPTIKISDLINKTHKINGSPITYTTTVDNFGDVVSPRVNLIGDNKTEEYKDASVVFYADAEPSYNLGEDNEDNSLLCTFAGRGTTKTRTIKAWKTVEYTDSYGKKRSCQQLVTLGKYRVINTLRGNNAGTLGCGCTAYGHVSPTRVAGALAPTCHVDDVASTYGSWQASYVETYIED